METLGKHILAELYDCNLEVLNNQESIQQYMQEAAVIAGATIVGATFHHFSPYGVSGTVIIAESHMAIHTWPEHGYAAIDLFTCGKDLNPWAAFDFLKEKFGSTTCKTIELTRGRLDEVTHKVLVEEPEITNGLFKVT